MRHEHEHWWGYGHEHWWGGHEHIWGYGHGAWAAMPMMMLGSLFLIALFIALTWLLLSWLTTRSLPAERYHSDLPTHHPAAFELLRQRYTRGEIDASTFEEMQEQLETANWQNHRQRRDPLKEDRLMQWIE